MNIDYNHLIEQPEALRLADEWQRETQREVNRRNSAYDHYGMGNTPETLDPLGAKMAAELRRLHAYCQDLESQVILDCMTHVQNPAENEHVVGDMSKNEKELNMSVQQPSAWVPLPGTLPEPGKPVLLDIGEKYPIRAMWAAKHTLEVGLEDDYLLVEYNEATDTYYCPEGWYEWNEHEECHWHVDKTPVAWCELPPKEQK